MSPQQRAHVREAFAELKAPGNEWVGLADIREKLEARGLDREQQDAVFRDMLSRDSDVRIIPVANTKALKPRDHAAAFELGGSPVHAMSIREENRRSRQPVTGKPVGSNRSDQEIRIELEALRDQLRVTTDAQQREALEQRISRLNPPAADGLDALEDRQLRSLATEWEVPADGPRERLIGRLRAVGATSPQANQAAMARGETGRIRERAMEALQRAGARNGETMGIEQLRAAMGGTRAEQDAILNQLNDERQINLMPQSNQKILTGERRAAALLRGGEDKTVVMLGSAANPGATSVTSSKPMRDRITDAYAELRREFDNEWVILSVLRSKLGGTRQEQDTALMELLRDRRIRLIPEENQQALTGADRDAALNVSGEDKHLIGFPDLQASTARSEANPQTVRAAYDQLAAGPGEWVSIADLRDRFPNVSREAMDALLRELEQRPDVNVVPQSNEKSFPERTRGAAVTIGGQRKHFIAMGIGEETPSRGRAAQRLSAAQGSDLDAKRQQLARLDAAAAAEGDISTRRAIIQDADDLRREIGRGERGDDAGKVDQPREITRAEVTQAYAELAGNSGDLVSLVRLRAKLGHIKHDELTAVLKEMDRARAIQLSPDPNQKALPPEAREAAVTLGGSPQHFISMAGVGGGSGGRAAQSLRGNPKA